MQITIAASTEYDEAELAALMSEMGISTEFRTYARFSAAPGPIIELALCAVALGFFQKLGSDAYSETKKRLIDIIRNRGRDNPSDVVFSWEKNSIRIEAACRSNNVEILNWFVDSQLEIKQIVDELIESGNVPENIREISVYFNAESRNFDIWTISSEPFKRYYFDLEERSWKEIESRS